MHFYHGEGDSFTWWLEPVDLFFLLSQTNHIGADIDPKQSILAH
jgi:hypothetical protein